MPRTSVVMGDMMCKLSEYTIQVLQQAGWNFQQVRVTSAAKQALVQNGFPYSPQVDKFLQQFLGLALAYSDIQRSWKPGGRLYIDPERVIKEHFEPDELSNEEEFLETKLSPLGYFQGMILLAMGLDGKLYGLADQVIVLYGNTGVEGIDNIICSRMPSYSQLRT